MGHWNMGRDWCIKAMAMARYVARAGVHAHVHAGVGGGGSVRCVCCWPVVLIALFLVFSAGDSG